VVFSGKYPIKCYRNKCNLNQMCRLFSDLRNQKINLYVSKSNEGLYGKQNQSDIYYAQKVKDHMVNTPKRQNL
jgi:hypothetical protein